MTLPTFTPPVPPSPGTTEKPKLKLLKTEFGDGYTQTARDGLNHIRRTISLTWEMLLPDDARQILDFLAGRGGDLPFWYTPSDETTPIKWTCEDWTDRREPNGLRTITATFEQNFSLKI